MFHKMPNFLASQGFADGGINDRVWQFLYSEVGSPTEPDALQDMMDRWLTAQGIPPSEGTLNDRFYQWLLSQVPPGGYGIGDLKQLVDGLFDGPSGPLDAYLSGDLTWYSDDGVTGGTNPPTETAFIGVTSFSGTLLAGQTVQIGIEGNFGTPDILYSSQFDTGSDGSTLSLSDKLAGDDLGEAFAKVSTSLAFSPTRSAQTFDSTQGTPIQDYTAFRAGANTFGAVDFNKVYVSYLGYKASNDSSDLNSSKYLWLMRGDRGDNPGIGGVGSGNDVFMRENISSGNTTADIQHQLNLYDVEFDWYFLEYGLSAGADPLVDGVSSAMSMLPSSGGVRSNLKEKPVFNDQSSNSTPPAWDRVKFGGYANVTGQLYQDDPYIAIGENCNCRALFTNASTLESSTKYARGIIQGYSGGLANVLIADGNIAWGSDTVYVHVWDRSGYKASPYNCSTNSPAGKERILISLTAGQDSVEGYSANVLPDRTQTGIIISDLKYTNGDASGISIAQDSSGWNGVSTAKTSNSEYYVPAELTEGTWSVSSATPSQFTVSGATPSSACNLICFGAYFSDTEDRTIDVVVNGQTGSFNSRNFGASGAVSIPFNFDGSGDAVITMTKNLGASSYLSWFMLEFD